MKECERIHLSNLVPTLPASKREGSTWLFPFLDMVCGIPTNTFNADLMIDSCDAFLVRVYAILMNYKLCSELTMCFVLRHFRIELKAAYNDPCKLVVMAFTDREAVQLLTDKYASPWFSTALGRELDGPPDSVIEGVSYDLTGLLSK